MPDVRGLKGQLIIWDWMARVYGLQGIIQSLQEDGLSLTSARRTANLMRAYWESRPVAQARPGHQHFPRFVDKLVNKPAPLPPVGDYSDAAEETYVLGSRAVQQILDAQPEFRPIAPLGQSYGFEDIYDAFQYMAGFTSGISRFLALIDTIWIPYLGATDLPIPDIPSFPPIEP